MTTQKRKRKKGGAFPALTLPADWPEKTGGANIRRLPAGWPTKTAGANIKSMPADWPDHTGFGMPKPKRIPKKGR